MECDFEAIKAKHLPNINNRLGRIPEKRRKDLLSIQQKNNEMAVFCDCSVLNKTRCAGIAVCFVGKRKVYLLSQKLERKNVGKNIFSELLAVKFALEALPNILVEYKYWKPSKVVVYSDVEAIENFIYRGTGRKIYMRRAIEEIKQLMDAFTDLFIVEIRYLGDERCYNIYYNAAHKASRNVIGK